MSSNNQSRGKNDTKKSVLKVLILGDGGVGKSCIMTRFINNHFDENSFHTIGVEFLNKEFSVNGTSYTLQIWDTAGQERFKSLRTPFYRGTDICLLVFALDDKSSFSSLSLWRQEFLHYADIQDPHNFPFIILGNKVDLADRRQVGEDESRQWCLYHGGLPYYNTSAKDDINVEQVFKEAVQQWVKRENDLDAEMKAKENIFQVEDKKQGRNRHRSCC